MDISTGRCPTRKVDCDCTKVCARLYGEKVREMRIELLSTSKEELPRKTKEFQRFVKKCGFTNTYNDMDRFYN